MVLDGRQVTIADAQGKIIALTDLAFELGHQVSSTGFGMGVLACTYAFAIPDLNSKDDFFTVKVDGTPGTQNVSRADLLAGLELTVE